MITKQLEAAAIADADRIWQARCDASDMGRYLSQRKLPTPFFYIAFELGWSDKRITAALKACGAKRSKFGFWSI